MIFFHLKEKSILLDKNFQKMTWCLLVDISGYKNNWPLRLIFLNSKLKTEVNGVIRDFMIFYYFKEKSILLDKNFQKMTWCLLEDISGYKNNWPLRLKFLNFKLKTEENGVIRDFMIFYHFKEKSILLDKNFQKMTRCLVKDISR